MDCPVQMQVDFPQLTHCWSWQVCWSLQLAQGTPPVPQAPKAFPGWHVPSEAQHPFGHDCGVQAQTPFWQFCPESQRAQACPPVPQPCLVFPGWQRPLSSQQPLGQLCGVQTHCPCPLQVRPSPVGQDVHWLPSTPQTGGVLARHRPGLLGPFSQQPSHWPGRQTQTWAKHWAPPPQSTQAAPPLPQKASTSPSRQMEPPLFEKQHPFGQLCPSQTHWPLALQRRPGRQAGVQAVHCWFRHPSPASQAAHSSPPVPQF